jgi:myo-inositol-1(or 4)-monophosphatase
MICDSLASRFLAAQAIATQAGRLARRFLDNPEKLGVKLKGPQDFVSAADLAVERLVIDRVAAAFPDDAIYGEESAAATGVGPADWLWVVDPIDGTANFVRGRADWCVSIAVLHAGVPEIGVICDPTATELFAGWRGHGATRNGVPIVASSCGTLSGATISLDHSSRSSASEHLAHARAILEQGGEYRRSGSAALSLAHVADGRLDGFVELHLSAWDVLAGIVLVNEAGGWTSDFLRGDGLNAGNPMIASAPLLRDALLAATNLGAWR